MEYSDHELVRGIKGGDKGALELLVRRWYPRIYGYVFKLTGHEQDACDLTQDVFIAMMQSIGSYTPWRKFDSWLFTIAHNKCMDYFRLRRKVVQAEDTVFDRPDSAASLEDIAELSASVKAALEKLPAAQREAVLLHYFHQFTVKEIAQMTNTPLPTVKSRLRAARSTLSDDLWEDFFMNERMEQEIRRTIRFLQASMPEPKNRQTSVFTLLRIAASEINAWLLLGLFVGALSFGLVSVRVLSMPMLTIFCTAPMPMLLLFHRYVLACDQRMRELEATFPYSYSEMLAARSVVISCCMFGALVLPFRDAARFRRRGFPASGALRGLYRAFISVRCFCFLSASLRNPEGLSLLAVVFWAALCFLAAVLPFDRLLQLCSTAAYAVLAAVGLIVYGILVRNVQRRRVFYDMAHIG